MEELTDATFQPFLEGTDTPVLVYFYAPHCATCRSVGPRFEELTSNTSEVLPAKLNTVSQYRTVQAINLRGVPALALYRKGEQVAFHAGNISAPDMQTWLADALKAA
ncbi:MAG: thioredoxin family protein [Brachymonas sp.]|nr:thioredoxin family protein [Brachymonas sp.]